MSCGSAYRRYEDVIHAFNRALPSIPDNVILVIVGSGSDLRYKKMLFNLIDQSPQPERILMMGSVKWSDMDLLYRNALCCIITSEIEACPNIAIEAMASGSLILASEISPLPEILMIVYYVSAKRHFLLTILLLIPSSMSCCHFKYRSKQRSISFSWSISSAKTYALNRLG